MIFIAALTKWDGAYSLADAKISLTVIVYVLQKKGCWKQ